LVGVLTMKMMKMMMMMALLTASAVTFLLENNEGGQKACLIGPYNC
jgi:hypothetical protein